MKDALPAFEELARDPQPGPLDLLPSGTPRWLLHNWPVPHEDSMPAFKGPGQLLPE